MLCDKNAVLQIGALQRICVLQMDVHTCRNVREVESNLTAFASSLGVLVERVQRSGCAFLLGSHLPGCPFEALTRGDIRGAEVAQQPAGDGKRGCKSICRGLNVTAAWQCCLREAFRGTPGI